MSEVIEILIPFKIIKTGEEDWDGTLVESFALVNDIFDVEDIWDENTPAYYDEASHPTAIISAWNATVVTEDVDTNERL